jgi:hypothetical protein
MASAGSARGKGSGRAKGRPSRARTRSRTPAVHGAATRDRAASQAQSRARRFLPEPGRSLSAARHSPPGATAAFESQLQFRMSRTMAIAEHGIAAVKEMEEAVKKANREGHPELPSLSAQMNASDDPVSVAMNWHKRSKLLDETGGDLAGYRQKTIEEALKDPAFLAKAMERRPRASAAISPGSRPSVSSRHPSTRLPAPASPTPSRSRRHERQPSLFKHATGPPLGSKKGQRPWPLPQSRATTS